MEVSLGLQGCNVIEIGWIDTLVDQSPNSCIMPHPLFFWREEGGQQKHRKTKGRKQTLDVHFGLGSNTVVFLARPAW